MKLIRSALIFSLLIIIACEKEDFSREKKYSYKIEETTFQKDVTCSTGLHEYKNHADMCHSLFIDIEYGVCDRSCLVEAYLSAGCSELAVQYYRDTYGDSTEHCSLLINGQQIPL